jgi:hypothetical protein
MPMAAAGSTARSLQAHGKGTEAAIRAATASSRQGHLDASGHHFGHAIIHHPGLSAPLQGMPYPLRCNAIATALGVEPQIARAQIEIMRAGFEQQAREVATDSVLMWAKEHRLDDLKAAARDQINVGSTKGYQKLQAAYVKDLPYISPETILNSPDGQRLQAQKDRQGNVTIMIPNVRRVEWRAAIASGLIAPRMARK